MRQIKKNKNNNNNNLESDQNQNPDFKNDNGGDETEPVALADEKRVRVLSPTMLVLKRFMRNKLAIAGMAIILSMFAFSFIGGIVSPYKQDDVFKKLEAMPLDYAAAVYNGELRYTIAEGKNFPDGARAEMMLNISRGEFEFTVGDIKYILKTSFEGMYFITAHVRVAEIETIAGRHTFNGVGGFAVDEIFRAAFEAAYNNGENSFICKGDEYFINKSSARKCVVTLPEDIGVASMKVFDPYKNEDRAEINDIYFRYESETAINSGLPSFSVNGRDYTVVYESGETVINKNGEPFAAVSDIIVSPIDPELFFTVDYKNAVRDAIKEDLAVFEFENKETGETASYSIRANNAKFFIKTDTVTEMIAIHSGPSREHWLGTDGNGMDMLTRLMYGGRVSLIVGFVVVLIEILIGVIIGGIAGYFGGWADTFLMRVVDLFNTIPDIPLLIIFGSLLDAYRMESYRRIMLLMVILGLMGWTGIARVVRGQILSLREQDFMTATEALGLKTSRRIFRHLVPNVMPLLIVQATMGLGGIIITEATLSYLGLGVKFPQASWGSIIHSAMTMHIMTEYWFAWIPAGILILLTVLGFNFVGDGLRDAFDPKMKR